MGMIEVLVVDDSPLMRRIISSLLAGSPDIHVQATAADGLQAIEMVESMRPHVVVMDVQMPEMDGLAALQVIMRQRPTPVVMLSGLSDASLVVRALQLGAVEFVSKPSGTLSIDLYKVRDELLDKVRLAASVNMSTLRRPPAEPAALRPPLPWRAASSFPFLVAIAASTGGPQTLDEIFRRLPGDLPAAFLIVQHMPRGFTASFSQRLDQHGPLSVYEGVDGMPVRPGEAYVAPGGRHMTVASGAGGYLLRLLDTPPVNAVRPSADVLMASVAELAGPASVGIVLTGMGRDGAGGLEKIRAAGGVTLAQDEASSVIFGMPRAAVERGVVDRVLPAADIPAAIVAALSAAGRGQVGR